MGNNNQFLLKHAFLPSYILIDFDRRDCFNNVSPKAMWNRVKAIQDKRKTQIDFRII